MSSLYSIEWAPVAIRDFEQILSYIIVNGSLRKAAQLHAQIVARINTLCRHPRRCRIVPELKEQGVLEYRELIIGPYRIFFHLRARKVGLVGVLDGRRDLEELILQRALEH